MISRAGIVLACALAGALVSHGAIAHEVRPALLEIKQVEGAHGAARFDTAWKLPRTGYATLKLNPAFSESCRYLQNALPEALPTAFRYSGALECEQGLRGAIISIEGLQTTLTDTLLRVRFADGDEFQALLNASSPSVEVPEAGTIGVPAYFILGVTHMLSGIDHLLFVLGLIILILGRPGDSATPNVTEPSSE